MKQVLLLLLQELCGKGGVLWLAQLVTKLNVSPSSKQSTVVAAISRMKSKVLSIVSPGDGNGIF